MSWIARVVIMLPTPVIWACDRPAQGGSIRTDDTARAAAPLIVDSILPSGEALRRFQSGLARVTDLEMAARTRDELVKRFISAVERTDTAALKGMLTSKTEYAYVYFPSSIYNRKPYELPPDIAWMLTEQNSRKGLTRLTRRLAGRKLTFSGYDCSAAVTEGENRFWRACGVTYIDPVSSLPVTKKLFGAIMERGDRYKFLSYANDF